MSTTSTQFKLGPASLTEALFESLRVRIINGDIPPGERVTEQRVADEYGVARPTAKSCLNRLTDLGLLRRVAHRSAIVPKLTVADITDLFFSRAAFEVAAARSLAQSRHLPDDMVKAQRTMKHAVEHEDFAEQVQSDIDFHWGIVRGLNSERMSRMYEMISGEIHLTMGQYAAHRRTSPMSVNDEHDAIMAAIRNGDAQGAASALADHLAHARDRVVARAEEIAG